MKTIPKTTNIVPIAAYLVTAGVLTGISTKIWTALRSTGVDSGGCAILAIAPWALVGLLWLTRRIRHGRF